MKLKLKSRCVWSIRNLESDPNLVVIIWYDISHWAYRKWWHLATMSEFANCFKILRYCLAVCERQSFADIRTKRFQSCCQIFTLCEPFDTSKRAGYYFLYLQRVENANHTQWVQKVIERKTLKRFKRSDWVENYAVSQERWLNWEFCSVSRGLLYWELWHRKKKVSGEKTNLMVCR